MILQQFAWFQYLSSKASNSLTYFVVRFVVVFYVPAAPMTITIRSSFRYPSFFCIVYGKLDAAWIASTTITYYPSVHGLASIDIFP